MTDQAQAVYAAEDLWENREPRARIKFGDWNEVWPFYWTLVEKCREAGIADLKVPKVKPRKGALKAHYDSATATVFIPPYSKGGAWALNTGTALHEFAHHMTPGAGHGPAFREAMVNLLGAIGWDRTAICGAQQRLARVACQVLAAVRDDEVQPGRSAQMRYGLAAVDSHGIAAHQVFQFAGQAGIVVGALFQALELAQGRTAQADGRAAD